MIPPATNPEPASARGAFCPTSIRRENALASLFVAVVWLGATIAAHVFVQRYGSTLPFFDDLELAPFISAESYRPWIWFWESHNEHRILVPKLVFLGVMLVFEDFRALMWCQVYLLSAIALAMILAARRLRGGRTCTTDALFPLLWLTWGNAFNLLMGFQVSLILPSAITGALLLLMLARPGVPRLGTVLWIGVGLLSLPLNGAPGLTPAPALIAWMLLAGWTAWRSGGERARRVAWAAWLFAAATAALIGLYFVHLDIPNRQGYNASLVDAAFQGVKFLSLVFGPAAEEYWPASGIALLAACALTVPLLVGVARRRPDERLRVAGLVCLAGGIFSMAVATGLARGTSPIAAFASRYVTLPAPLLCALYLAWTLYGSPATGRFVRVTLYSLLLGLLFYNVQYGARTGEQQRSMADRLMVDIESGLSLDELAQRHWQNFYNTEDGFAHLMGFLRRFGLTPIARVAAVPRREPDLFPSPPSRIESAVAPFPVQVGRRSALGVPPPCALFFDLPPDARGVSGELGIHPRAWRGAKPAGARFTVELWLREDVQPRVLWERVLRPSEDPRDRGLLAFAVDLPPEAGGKTLILRTALVGPRDPDVLPCWRGITVR